MKKITAKFPLIPFSKGGDIASLWQREVGRDFINMFQTAKLIRNFLFWERAGSCGLCRIKDLTGHIKLTIMVIKRRVS
jgi:hypothetical protein